jgi:signal peptidase II
MNIQSQESQGIFQNRMAFTWLLAAVVIVVLDLWTKNIATQSLILYRPVELTSWLNLTLAHNYGAAFSFLSDAGGWQRWLFTGLASVVTVVLVVWLFRLPAREKLTAAAATWLTGSSTGMS